MSTQAKVVVVDLDGTLANMDHRAHMVRSEDPDWDAFFRACVNDTPNNWCVQLIQSMADNRDVLIVSARSKVVEKETRAWLAEVLGPDYLGLGVELVMLREAGDSTPDVDLKRRWLHGFGKEKVLFVVDDRQRVVDMWRAEGVTCLQCYAWEEFKKAKGTDL